MRRWNGWGDESISSHLPDSAVAFLAERVGPGTPPFDATLGDALAAVPPALLPEHPLFSRDPLTRLLHARGQSLPDWVALRSGSVDSFPDAVAFPESADQIRELLQVAAAWGARVVPYGGGTSVVGHITPPAGPAPVLTISMRRLNRLLRLDPQSRLASFGAGVTGPDLEAQLRARGLTLGHFPQSFEYSTLGGWVATRSSGQQSLRYGRIEQLFAGGRLETPAGPIELPPYPASAAGPDLRQLVLGSEGRLGVITEATVRVTPLPAREETHAVFFPGWEPGLAATRTLAQSGLPLAMLRLSTAEETATNLALAGRPRVIAAVQRYLAMRGIGPEACMLLIGLAGDEEFVSAARRAALALSARHGGVSLGRTFGRQWTKNRFRTPYLRNAAWEHGYAIDTLETAAPWERVPALVDAIEAALHAAIAAAGERVHAFTHLSHVYPGGSSIYTTLVFRLAADPAETLRRWRLLKEAASRAVLAHGGTISHQHGVGLDHRDYLAAEKGELGLAALRAAFAAFDPQGIMNPDKLVC